MAGVMTSYTQRQRETLFKKIDLAYAKFEAKLKAQGRQLVWETEKGIYGAAPCRRLFELFQKVELENFKGFIDLGSGDGRAVLIASLFTDATGIEADEELVAVGQRIRHELGLNAKFVHGDFLEQDISEYDLLFINPDQGFHKGLDEKLAKEMTGTLLVHNNIFLPEKLKKGKTVWVDETPVIMYTKA
jgi:hypothetical protein